ncbi:O-antigen ligase family protein [Bacillus badius]|uniref:O-antigen ligase family protein n=1 Tax=Bacillus badius TaxID=1455 RepID=UPI002E1D64AC|nr:O-antigen ligase family protein [Bacillus badius]
MSDFLKNNILMIGAVFLILIGVLIPQPLIGLAVSLALAVISFFYPKIGIYSLLVYFPLRSFLIEINPSMKIMGDLVIVFAFLHVVWAGRKDWRSLVHFSIFEWAFFAFIGIGSVSALMSDVSLAAIIFQVRAFLITYLLFYIVKRLNIDKEDVQQFICITIAVALLLVCQGLIEKISLRTLFLPETWANRSLSPNNRVRIYGLINNPNILAVYLTFALIFLVHLYNKVSKGKKVLLAVLSILYAGTWLLTYSRGTWLACCIGLVIFWLFTRYTRITVQLLATVVLGFVLVLTPVTKVANWLETSRIDIDSANQGSNQSADEGDSVAKSRIETTFEKDTIELSKSSGRLFIVNKGFEIFKDHPVAGTGFATFGDSASKSYPSPIYETYEIPPNIYSDNQYIQVIAETGVLGVIAFAVFLLGMLASLWQRRTENKKGSFLLISILLSIFFLGLLYNIWEDKTFASYYFIMLAYALYHQRDGGNYPSWFRR